MPFNSVQKAFNGEKIGVLRLWKGLEDSETALNPQKIGVQCSFKFKILKKIRGKNCRFARFAVASSCVAKARTSPKGISTALQAPVGSFIGQAGIARRAKESRFCNRERQVCWEDFPGLPFFHAFALLSQGQALFVR